MSWPLLHCPNVGFGMTSSKDPRKAAPETELYPDAWERFRTAVHVMAKAGPQHRIGVAAVKSGPKHKSPKSKIRPSSKGRVHKGKT
jgi:hypothetical protein